ncbi:nuclear RNA export factor 1 [Paramuricea clavata]|uniref:Nuclear RNA export factor 1 n=2 Tax=Paramuricea clavata TaxID=317549 RepID=A0A7D9D9J8_PARCT|nr:nuclear RNA export factor 1 [Paramuricea clavata]
MIVKLIKECCPQLQNLDLRKNRISTLDALKDLHEAAPSMSTLHLGENNLRHINELKKIKNLKELKSLVVDGNPLCDNYSNSQTGYVSEIRSVFPKLVSLGSFIPDELTKKLVLPFVKQYLAVYDSDNRQKLLDAYDDEAVFSMCVVDFKNRGNTSNLISVYRKHSRNMKFLHDTDRKLELLKSSRISVVAFLNDLPSTKHDLESLTVDVNFVQPTCMGFTVCGLFKEGSTEELRAFTRAFIAVPSQGNSIAIINDQLSIRSPTADQREFASKSAGFGNTAASPSLFPVSATPVSSPNPMATLSPQATPSLQVSSLTTPSPLAGLNAQQQQMVTQFATQSGMNFNYSFKALSENNWDYQKAAEVFKTLHTQGKIPPEAFAKMRLFCIAFNISVVSIIAVLPSSRGEDDLENVDDVPPWGYGKTNDQVYGVDAWKNISKMCSGLRQSPINIKHGRARKKRNRSKISVQFTLENGQVYGDLKNNGHSPVFTVNASRASAQLTNVPNHRKDIYILKKIYFRFGCTERAGSEHQFDGVPTPGEIHLVFYKDQYRTLDRAMSKTDGLVILAVLLGGDLNYNRGLTDITTHLSQIKESGDEVSLKKGVRLSYLVPELAENKLKYYTYKGSITTPPCYESVRWFVMKSPIAITKQQLQEFRLLEGSNGRMCDNFRQVQKLHRRFLSLYV